MRGHSMAIRARHDSAFAGVDEKAEAGGADRREDEGCPQSGAGPAAHDPAA